MISQAASVVRASATPWPSRAASRDDAGSVQDRSVGEFGIDHALRAKWPWQA